MKNTLMTIAKIIASVVLFYVEMTGYEVIAELSNELYDLLYLTVDLSADAATVICLTVFIVGNYIMVETALYVMMHTQIKVKWVSCKPKKEVKVSYMPKVAKGAN